MIVPTPQPRVFAWLDDAANTGMHMNRSSRAMFGGALPVERLSSTTTGVGTTYRAWGRVLGLPIDFTTMVTEWAPDRKKWRTTGAPRLIVLGGFEMFFVLTPVNGGPRVALAIRYNLPPGRFGRGLGQLLAAPYARWCVRQQ